MRKAKPKQYPPLLPGTIVMTTKPNMAKKDEWTEEGWNNRHWGVIGKVIEHHDSHGLCYDVVHPGQKDGCYDPSELEVGKVDEIDYLLALGKENKIILELYLEEFRKIVAKLPEQKCSCGEPLAYTFPKTETTCNICLRRWKLTFGKKSIT